MTSDQSPQNPFDPILLDIIRPTAVLILPPNGHPEQYTQLVQSSGCFILVSSKYYRIITRLLTQEFPHLGTVALGGHMGCPSRFTHTEGPNNFVINEDGKVNFRDESDPSPPETDHQQ